jgi:sporulation protein YlmC with PRC-barrel domain
MRLSQLLGKTVVDQDGHDLGVVHDVAATQDGPPVGAFGAALQIDAVIVGTTGMRARLGLTSHRVAGPGILRSISRLGATTDEIPWTSVIRIDDHHITVRTTDRP